MGRNSIEIRVGFRRCHRVQFDDKALRHLQASLGLVCLQLAVQAAFEQVVSSGLQALRLVTSRQQAQFFFF